MERYIVSTKKSIGWMKGDRVAVSDISDYYIFPIQTSDADVIGEELIGGGSIAGCFYTRESIDKYFSVCSGMSGLPLVTRDLSGAKAWAKIFARRDDMISSHFAC